MNSRGSEDVSSLNSGSPTCKKANWFPHFVLESGLTISSSDLYPLMFLVLSSTNAVDCELLNCLPVACIYNRVPRKTMPCYCGDPHWLKFHCLTIGSNRRLVIWNQTALQNTP